MKKKHYLSKTQYLRLQGYLYDLHKSGEACVFSDMSGHVDWLRIRVVNSTEDYTAVLFDTTLYVGTEYKPDRTDTEVVDDIITSIKEVLEDRKNILKQQQIALEEAERKKYEELKAKFDK